MFRVFCPVARRQDLSSRPRPPNRICLRRRRRIQRKAVERMMTASRNGRQDRSPWGAGATDPVAGVALGPSVETLLVGPSPGRLRLQGRQSATRGAEECSSSRTRSPVPIPSTGEQAPGSGRKGRSGLAAMKGWCTQAGARCVRIDVLLGHGVTPSRNHVNRYRGPRAAFAGTSSIGSTPEGM